jgi:hypothetical protein
MSLSSDWVDSQFMADHLGLHKQKLLRQRRSRVSPFKEGRDYRWSGLTTGESLRHAAPPGGQGRKWREIGVAIDDACHNLFITKQRTATVTVELNLPELMEVTVQEMPHMVDREALEISDNKINSIYEKPLASAQRKRWLNSIDFNPAGPFCAIACGEIQVALTS